MSDEQLLELVKRNSVLYDKSSCQYRDHSIRNNAWEVIAEELHTTVEECKERWGRLRNCFTNALKRRHKKSLKLGSEITSWRYGAQMEFLLPHVEDRRTDTNLSAFKDDDSTEEEESQFSEEPESPRADTVSPTFVNIPTPNCSSVKATTPNSSSVRTPTSSIYRTVNRNTIENDNNIVKKELVDVITSSHKSRQKRIAEMDETDYFFLSMSKQLKKLPPMDQSNIKFQMHKLIHDAEINMIKKSEQSRWKHTTKTRHHAPHSDAFQD